MRQRLPGSNSVNREKVMLSTQDWLTILQRIAGVFERSQERLNALDGAIGDGDHGVSMVVGFRAVLQTIESYTGAESLDRLFRDAGEAFLTAVGGAIGPLIGTMFTDAGKKLAGCPAFGVAQFRDMLIAMENAVVRRGKAEIGDKTILDSLHPAVETVQVLAIADLSELSRAAAKAAEQGAEATAALISKRGRSARLGERTLGHPDAGATSLSLILQTIAESITELPDNRS